MPYPEYPEKEKSVPSVESTENGKTRESDFSLTPKGSDVKFIDSPLDPGTEIFMLGALIEAMKVARLDFVDRYKILYTVISGCTEANEA